MSAGLLARDHQIRESNDVDPCCRAFSFSSNDGGKVSPGETGLGSYFAFCLSKVFSSLKIIFSTDLYNDCGLASGHQN
jgi:hypothetical protein